MPPSGLKQQAPKPYSMVRTWALVASSVARLETGCARVGSRCVNGRECSTGERGRSSGVDDSHLTPVCIPWYTAGVKRRPPKIQRSLRLSEAAWQAIDRAASEAGLSPAEVVEEWALRTRQSLEARVAAIESEVKRHDERLDGLDDDVAMLINKNARQLG